MTREPSQIGETKADHESGSDPRGQTPEAEPDELEGSDPTGLTPEVDALVQLAAERDEYLADLQRLAAEFENYRKRALRDQERLVAHAHERLVRELLPIVDDLERALEAAERHEEAALVDGVKLVEQSLRKVLVKEGLVEIETDGVFDPHVHEALLARLDDDAEPGSVLEVVQRGYRLGDKVVRPARVIVAE
ncbi:MAG: Molecular chaperone GrpE (heat shock protein) [Thermoleophilia bacterium]|nr:Molecular chaperone GrpE (heat shock protein) [Thermoleophilia bacterium]